MTSLVVCKHALGHMLLG